MHVTDNYMTADGKNLVIGGTLEILSTGRMKGARLIERFVRSSEETIPADKSAILKKLVLQSDRIVVRSEIGEMPCARTVTATPSVALAEGEFVIIEGYDSNGATIKENLYFDGTKTVEGVKAFAQVASVGIPPKVTAAQRQRMSVNVNAGATTEATETVTLISALYDAPITAELKFSGTETPLDVANCVVQALGVNVQKDFYICAENETIVVEAKEAAANDSTLALTITDGGSGVGFGEQTTLTEGVEPATLDIGFGDTYGLDKAMPVGCICIGPAFVDGAEADAPTFNCSKLLEESTLKFGTAPDNKTIEINYLNR